MPAVWMQQAFSVVRCVTGGCVPPGFWCLSEQQLADLGDVVPAVHPGMSAARIHCLVLDASVLEVLLKLERRLVKEV